jgi:hypothetical protein
VAPVSALRDTVPASLALLEPWDASISAARAIAVLSPGPAREELVSGLREAAAALTWEATGERLVAAYHEAVALPAPPAARLSADLARAEHDYWSVRDGICDELWALVRPDAPRLDPVLARDLSAVLDDPRGTRMLRGALRVARRLPGARS